MEDATRGGIIEGRRGRMLIKGEEDEKEEE